MASAVTFEHVTKRYLRGGTYKYRSLRSELVERIQRIPRRLRGGITPRGTLALDDVSFEMPEGESLAIIGPNGSGKTTALKLITRISYPTEGRIRVRGRVAALIEVGSGIHPELTGRENVWLYGRILGMSKEQVAGRFDEIVEFAELGHAIDRQVKMFSSGMQLRLGFSIASHLDPELFLVDEALAVGDADFQQRCVERMAKLVGEGRSLIFVSHDLSAVQSTCSRGIFLLDGQVRDEGPIHDVVSEYLGWVDRGHEARDAEPATDLSRRGGLKGITVHGSDGTEQYAFTTGDDVEVRFRFSAEETREGTRVSMGVREAGQRKSLLVQATTQVPPDAGDPPGEVVVACRLRGVPLLPRIYEIWGSVSGDASSRDLVPWQPLGTFRIAHGPGNRAPAGRSPVHVETDWLVGPG